MISKKNSLPECVQPQTPQSEEHSEPSVFMEDALSIPLIADGILKYLLPAQILACSLVSRSWRDPCRQYLRRGKVYVVVTNPTCSRLQALDELLAGATAGSLPFVGLTFEDSKPTSFSSKIHCQRCKRYRHENVDTLYPFIFSTLEIKVLKIHYVNRRTCIADKFLKSMLKKKADGIEEMRISGWSNSIPSLWSYISLPASSIPTLFPSLQVCRLRRLPEVSRAKAVLIREILLSAPNLSYLDVIVPTSMFSSVDDDNNSPKPQFPKNKYHTIKSFRCSDTNSVVHLAREKPRLEYLSLWPSLLEQDEEVIQKVLAGVATICESSFETLKTLECRYNMIFLQFLPSRSFVRLTTLDLTFSRYTWEYFYVNFLILKSIDLRPIFPNLREVTWKVDVKPGAGYFRDYDILLHELDNLAEEYYCYGTKLNMLERIAILFPEVRTFYMKEAVDFWEFWREVSGAHGTCGTSWEDTLETVGYCYNIRTKDFPLALLYIFCGIESEELKAICDHMDEKALKDWQFAPTIDAPITQFLRLPKVELFFEHEKDQVCGDEQPVPYSPYLERMLERLMRWMRAKLPALVLHIVVVNPCSKNCDRKAVILEFKPCEYI